MIDRTKFREQFPNTDTARYIERRLNEELVSLRLLLENATDLRMPSLQGEIKAIRRVIDILCLQVHPELTLKAGSSNEHPPDHV